MVYTDFEHSVSFRRDSTSPLTVELTCTNVLRRRIRLFTDETKTFSLPAEQTIDHHTSFIPLNELTSSPDTQHNVVYDIVRSPDETTVISRQSKITNNYSLGNGCSTILREIDMAITSSSSRGRGVVETKICKIKTEILIYKANKAAEKLLIDSYGYIYNSNESTTEENECVICMEDYTEGSIVTKNCLAIMSSMEFASTSGCNSIICVPCVDRQSLGGF